MAPQSRFLLTALAIKPLDQLKILQEVVTLTIFVLFSLIYLREKMDLDYLWAGCCLLGAVFFLLRRKLLGI